MSKFTDLMFDWETLSTRADAVVLSLGAVRFNKATDEIDNNGFYQSITIQSNLDSGRFIDENTMKWWLQQSPEAQKVFHEPKVSLEQAMGGFADWFGEPDKNIEIWSNGSDFDIPIMAHIASTHDWELPWKFWNHRCFRTMKNLPKARGIKPAEVGVKHNALSDSINQARHLQAIWKAVNK